MKITEIYVEQVLSNGAAANIAGKEIKEKAGDIEKYVDAQFLSWEAISLLNGSDMGAVAITSLGLLIQAVCTPCPIRKLRLASIVQALEMATHHPFEKCSESEYKDLLKHIAEEIMDYSVVTGNENQYTAGAKVTISAAKKFTGKILNPIIKPFKAPANIVMIKWILAGIHQALVRYFINRDVFNRSHSIAVSEACKGYEDVLSNRFKNILMLTYSTLE